jgi:hypothetical protein
MQNEQSAKSGASTQHSGGASKDGEVLSPVELTNLAWGRTFKRYVRAAAALREIYDDTALAEAIGRSRGAVGQWWLGARPEIETIRELGRVTGLSIEGLISFAHFDGPPPTLPEAGSPVVASVREGLRRDRERPQNAAHGTPAPSPARRSRGSGVGRG